MKRQRKNSTNFDEEDEANEELTQVDEQQFIQQINVVKGGDSVNTNSSTSSVHVNCLLMMIDSLRH